MKLALIFLVVFCSVSLNGQYYRPGQQYKYMQSPRGLFYPAFGYAFHPYLQPAVSYNFDDLQNDQDNIGVGVDESDDQEGDVQSRARLQQLRPAQGKFGFYGSNLFNANLLSAFSSLNIATFTSTSLTTTTSTVTIASIKSCINSSQFVAGSTNTCSRKRRGIPTDNIEAIAAIAPSQVEPLEATAQPIVDSFRDRSLLIEQPEIVSSQVEEKSIDQTHGNRQKRAVIVTVTSTITAYSFSTTSVVKSYTLVSTAAQSLQCLPVGYTVC